MRLHTPDVILTAAPRDVLRVWLDENKNWIGSRAVFQFAGYDDAVDAGLKLGRSRRVQLFLRGDRVDGPCAVVGWNGAEVPELDVFEVRDENDPAQITAAVTAAAALAAHRPGAIVWEAMGELSDGLLALGAACARPEGRAVCQATATPGPLNVAVSQRWGASVRVVVDGEKLRELIADSDRGAHAWGRGPKIRSR